MKIEHNEWLPSFLFSGVGRDVDTTYFFRPHVVSREESALFDIKVSFYRRGVSKPLVLDYKDVCFNSDWTLRVRDVLPDYDHTSEEYVYTELFASSRNLEPNVYNHSLTFFGQHTSTDGRLAGYLATNSVWGAPRRVYRERYFCDTFPGARIDDELCLKIFVVNPFVRKCSFRVTLYHSAKGQFITEWKEIAGHSVETIVLDTATTGGTTGLFGVMLEADTKVASFYSTVSRKTGQMIGIDHGHPYLLDVLSH
ncbi:MAG: hypothetical protein ABIP97_04660 [Chthoniobacterales bacterium]